MVTSLGNRNKPSYINEVALGNLGNLYIGEIVFIIYCGGIYTGQYLYQFGILGSRKIVLSSIGTGYLGYLVTNRLTSPFI